jgi:mRNA interferase RelE/StbE
MAIKFRKNAIKFLEKANLEDTEKIQEKISQLLAFVEEQAIIPFTELDIKKMKGEWEGFYRLRTGKIRIVFTANTQSGEVEIFTIGTRGDVYK